MGIAGDAFEFPKPKPAEVYQEAALSLRYKRITAITATKLQRAMALLQLEPHHLVMRGLASRSSLMQGLGSSDKGRNQPKSFSVAANFGNSVTEAIFSQRDLNGIEEEHDGTQDDQDDGWGGYEDDYDSDSDIDDNEDQHDEIEGRRNGPIYAFLVYGGVQLRPDEYILLFRVLGVSPQYIEQLQCSNNKINQKPFKTPSCYSKAHNHHPGGVAHPDDTMIERMASQYHGSSSWGRDKIGIRFREKDVGQRGISLRPERHESSSRHMSYRYTPNIYHRGSTSSHTSAACSSKTSTDFLQQRQPRRQLPTECRSSGLRTMVAGHSSASVSELVVTA